MDFGEALDPSGFLRRRGLLTGRGFFPGVSGWCDRPSGLFLFLGRGGGCWVCGRASFLCGGVGCVTFSVFLWGWGLFLLGDLREKPSRQVEHLV